MKRYLSSAICAATLLLSSVSIDAIASAAVAQTDDEVDFQTFHDALAPYGDWVYSDRWGEVWAPEDVSYDFRPYDSDGYWAYTNDYGWMWVSNYEWGDIPFHYGRWVNDPDDGWLWIPGYVWSPAWVVWRSNGRYVGWMPMPPDREFLEAGRPSLGISFGRGLGISVNFGSTSGYYGYSDWYGPDYSADNFASNWVFVDEGHMADHDYRRYEAPRNSYVSLIRKGRNVTHYSVSNNFIVNKSIDPRAVQRAGGRPVPVVSAAQVIKKPQWITSANQGEKIQARMRTENPRGTGAANSAPKPSAQIVQSLSTKVAPHNGRPAAHLFTRDTVTNAPLPTKPGGQTEKQESIHTNPMMAPGSGTNPNVERRVGPNATPPSSTVPGQPSGPTEFMRRQQPLNGAPTTQQATPPSQPTNPNASPTSNQTPFSEHRHENTNPNPSGPAPTQTPPARHEFATPPQSPSGPATPGGANNPVNSPGLERFRQMQQSNPGGGNAQPGQTAPTENMRARPPVTAQPSAPPTPPPTVQHPVQPTQATPNPPPNSEKKKHDENGKPQ